MNHKLKKERRRDLLLTCLAYMLFGIGLTVQQLGIKAGLGIYATTSIFVICLVSFVTIVFTSMQNIKDALFDDDAPLGGKQHE